MRTEATLFYTTKATQMTTAASTLTARSTFSPPAANIQQHSPWHSPIPYLFGGLAAMLGLIAFALLILACSYWKLSGQMSSEDEGDDRDLEAGKGDSSGDAKGFPVFEEKFLVIMAGEMRPTFLATPMSSRASSFNDHEKQHEERDTKQKQQEHAGQDDAESHQARQEQ